MGGVAACCPAQFFETRNCSKYAALQNSKVLGKNLLW